MAITQSPTLNGSSQYFSRSNASQVGLGLTSNYTLECWVNFNVLPSVSGTSNDLIAKGDTLGGYRFFVDNANKLNIQFRNVGGTLSKFQSTSALSLTTGTWTHLAGSVTIGAPSAVLTQDGTSIAVSTIASGATTMANDITSGFTLGALDNSGTPTDYSNTRISLARVWSTNLSAGTIDSNKCTFFNSAQTNMQGEWSLDNVLTDSSGNANTLTNNGTITFGTNVPACFAGGATIPPAYFTLLGVGQ